jgi:hypothetical protein
MQRLPADAEIASHFGFLLSGFDAIAHFLDLVH